MNITIDKAVLEQVLAALEQINSPYWSDFVTPHIAQLREALAQPQPVQDKGPMAKSVEEAASDVSKCLNERDGQGLDLRHVAMLVNHAQQPVQEPVKGWIPIETAPKDSSMLRLLVNFDDHSLEDGSEPCWTIGTNALSDTGIDEWLFAGWDWTHDRFTQGNGTPIGWLPMLYTTPQSAPQPLTVAGGAVFQDAEGKRPVTAIGQPVGRWEPTPLYPPGGAGVFLERPQAQPLTHLQAKALVEKYGNDPLHLIFQTEAAHGITKGTK